MLKILIAEDEEDLSTLLKFILEQFNYEVMQAFDGKHALEIINSGFKPDIIVSDVMMPEMDGYTFVMQLQESNSTKDIPVIIMTAKGQTKELFQSVSSVGGFLEKPFEPQKLKEMIEQVVSRYGKQ